MTLRDEPGFTLQEIMVAMVISSIIISLSLSLFLFSDKLFRKWHDSTEFKAAVNRTAQVICYDIERSSQMVALSDSSVMLQIAPGKQLCYRFDGQEVTRNDIKVFSEEQGKCKVMVTRESGSNAQLYHISVNATSRSDHYEVETTAAIPYSSRAEFHRSL